VLVICLPSIEASEIDVGNARGRELDLDPVLDPGDDRSVRSRILRSEPDEA
jgi:hypothetical protein